MLSCCNRIPRCAFVCARRSLCMSCTPLDVSSTSKSRQNSQRAKRNNNEKSRTKWREKVFNDLYVKKFLNTCSLFSTGLSSLLGSAAARKAGMSPVGSIVLSFAAGMGGGTIRELFLGNRVFWLKGPTKAFLCLGTGLLGAYGWEELKKYTGITEDGLWAKLISIASLGGCTCSGTMSAIPLTSNIAGQFVYGAGLAAITATGGGCLRDYMLQRRPGVLYDGFENAIPAVLGSVAFQTARMAHASLAVQTLAAFVSSCGLRSYVRYYRSSKNTKKR